MRFIARHLLTLCAVASGVGCVVSAYIFFTAAKHAGWMPWGGLMALPFVAIWLISSVKNIRDGIRRARADVVDERYWAGKCLHCGYDLRACPGRCPECGVAAIDSPPRESNTSN